MSEEGNTNFQRIDASEMPCTISESSKQANAPSVINAPFECYHKCTAVCMQEVCEVRASQLAQACERIVL